MRSLARARVPQVHHRQLLPRLQASALEEFARRGAVEPGHLAEGPAHGTARPDVERILTESISWQQARLASESSMWYR